MIIPDPIYGEIKIAEPVHLELIQTPALERLKGVDQNVTGRLANLPWGNYTRFDHSIGVMWLIKRLGGNLEEQVAGLLHDISHTAFSHAVDFVFDKADVQDFHEEHLGQIVMQSNIPELLNRFGLEAGRIINHHNFPLLEQEIPALCADRVDYALKTFHQSQGYTSKRLRTFLDDLDVVDRKMVFIDEGQARKFASMFLVADQTAWGGSAIANVSYHLFSQIVKEAYEKGVIKLDDFFTTDEQFLEKLDADSRQKVQSLRNLKIEEVGPDDDYNLHLNAKIRYVDPSVKISGQVAKKLSEINPDFKKELVEALEKRKQGNYVKILT